MQSHIQFDEGVIDTFTGLKMKSTHRYLVLKINDSGDKIVIDKLGEKAETFENMTDALPDDEGRYIVFDYEKNLDDGRQLKKLLYIFWSPDTASIKKKVLYSNNNGNIKSTFDLSINISCHDRSDIEQEEIDRRVK